MRALVEGPRWAGLWTEIACEALETLGHRSTVHYHNERSALASVSNRAWRFSHRRSWLPTVGTGHAERSNRTLREAMRGGGFDLLLSIQGKLDPPTLDAVRAANPGLRVIFWWGDILTARGRERLHEIAPLVDRVLVAYRGDHAELLAAGHENVELLLFGVSPRFHLDPAPSAAEGRRYACDVALVGTCYPRRCELVHALRRKGHDVKVWGRSWRRCPGARAGPALVMAEGQKVHACARIALNVHHADTRDGLNMKYFEIPAAGGFQLVDHQPLLDESIAGRGVATFHDEGELLDKVAYYLGHEAERRREAADTRERMLASDTYARRFAPVLERLGVGPPPA